MLEGRGDIGERFEVSRWYEGIVCLRALGRCGRVLITSLWSVSKPYPTVQAHLKLASEAQDIPLMTLLTIMTASTDPDTACTKSIPPAQGDYHLFAETTKYTTALHHRPDEQDIHALQRLSP